MGEKSRPSRQWCTPWWPRRADWPSGWCCGGPLGRTRTLVVDLYSQAFDSKQLGAAAAVGMVGIVIALVVVVGSRAVTRAVERSA